jgi:hypothetical protein
VNNDSSAVVNNDPNRRPLVYSHKFSLTVPMNMQIDRNTLILIPCCAAKESKGRAIGSPTDPLVDMVSPQAYMQVLAARRTAYATLIGDSSLNEGTFAKNRLLQYAVDIGGQANSAKYLAAADRYIGTLYSVPGVRSAIRSLVGQTDAPSLLILSALYGPLHPLSPIQDYNLRMDQAPARIWRTAFPAFLEHYVRAHAIRRVVLLVGTSTNYFRVASAATLPLLQQGLLEDVVQYHVIDGSTRITPREHGHKLLGMLTGLPYHSALLEPRRLDGRAVRSDDASVRRGGTWLSTATATAPVSTIAGTAVFAPGMRRAQPPGQTIEKAPQRAPTQPQSIAPKPLRVVSETPPLPIRPQRHSVPEPVMMAATPTKQTPLSNAIEHGETATHRTRFHQLLLQLSTGPDQGLSLSDLIEHGKLPIRGVYFFMDARASMDPATWRVCRVGTHAVSIGSKSTLRTRLKTHLGSRSGNGNHRGSIFRLHVGNAMLRLTGTDLQTWGVGSVAPAALRESEALRAAEAALEQAVSAYIGALRVLWIDVPDAPGPNSLRSTIERNSIAILSANQEADQPPLGWLGYSSTRKEILSSKLWNVNHVNAAYDPAFIAILDRAVALTLSERK